MVEDILSVKCQVLSRAGRAGSLPRPLTSNLTLQPSGPAPAAEGHSYQTKPTSPAGGRPKGPGYPTDPLFYHSTIPIRCRSCQTKPMSRLRISDCGLRTDLLREGPAPCLPRGRTGHRRTKCAKQTQLGWAGPGGSGSGRARGVVQTNPISGGPGGVRRAILRKKVNSGHGSKQGNTLRWAPVRTEVHNNLS
jgi:hypothetical protein